MMKTTISISLLILLGSCTLYDRRTTSCTFDLNDCPAGYICSVKHEKSSCVNIPPPPWFHAQFPLAPEKRVKCKFGNRAKIDRHAYDHDLYAIDLFGEVASPPAKIYAAASGVAHIYDECPYRQNGPTAHNSTLCGGGLGNHIKIVHPDGYISLYAHLAEIKLQDGQKVKKGDFIAMEGASGNAGNRHLHFSVHRPWDLALIRKLPGIIGQSVPFTTNVVGQNDKISSLDIDCGLAKGAPLQGLWVVPTPVTEHKLP